MSDGLARALFAVFFVAFVTMRLYYHWKAGAFTRRHTTEREHVSIRRLRLVTPLWFVLALFYLAAPARVAWLQVDVPDVVRWTGALALYASLLLSWWINFTLGRNFSGTLVLQDGHVLVRNGPYRRVRHPMYPTFLLMGAAMGLLTGHLLIGVPVVVGVALVMIIRTPQEEAMMIERFGNEYRRYMAETGKYLPRFASTRRAEA